MNLGNNGLLEVTPAQGLKLSKTVDIVEPDTSTDFSFRITVHTANGTPFTGQLNSWITALDVVPLGAPTEIGFSATGTWYSHHCGISQEPSALSSSLARSSKSQSCHRMHH